MGELEGRVALVTGAARGFGRAVARLLAENGADVAVSDLANPAPEGAPYPMSSREQLDTVAADIAALGRRSVAIVADVTKSADCERMAAEARDALGPIDILVCNAGVWTRKFAWELSEQEWDYVVDVNLKGTFLTTRYVMPDMIQRQRGSIVMVSSIGGIRAYPKLSNYIAAKHGVIGYMKALAIELGPYNVNVNAICPTDMGRPEEGAPPETGDGSNNLFVQRGVPSFAEVAEAVLWLVSPRSWPVTGHALPMDAGWIARRGG